jgi:uncharacterized membrane protein YoaK (UPF0700 family)
MPQTARTAPTTVNGGRAIMFATAFAAGAVDIIGFAKLGGVFASAMTGNFAMLAYHLAQGNMLSAVGSVIALAGFVTGCLCGFTLRRGHSGHMIITALLAVESALLLVFALYSLWGPATAFIPVMRLQIVILAVAMGLQAVVGQLVSHSTIVFTTTLTRLLGGIADAIATRTSTGLRDVREQVTLIASYLLGALSAGTLAIHEISGGVFLPLGGVAVALAAHCLFHERAS